MSSPSAARLLAIRERFKRSGSERTFAPKIRAGHARTPARPGKLVSRFKRVEDEWQIAFGEIYIPGIPDSQGDFMTPDEVRRMAYKFVAQGKMSAMDVQHDRNVDQSIYLVESFIARQDDPEFVEGSWVGGAYCPDPVWEKVKSGELNGFSIQVISRAKSALVDLYVPDYLEGFTFEAEGHKHNYVVRFNDHGQFVGGTTIADKSGHMHQISQGTATNPAEGHTHRYSFVEQFQALQLEGAR